MINDRVIDDTACNICRAALADGIDPRTAFVNPSFDEHVERFHRPRIMDQADGPNWALFNGDSAEVLPGLPDASIDLSVFSPPFSSTYTYSPSDRDLGNVPSDDVFWQQFAYVSRELLRLMKPGRIVAVHVADLPAYEVKHGFSGRRDFSGDTIRHFTEMGFHYHSRITIDKNPQAQAIRTHSKGLLFAQLERDSAAMWQAWADYLLLFRAPGKNETRIPGEVTLGGTPEERQNEWIELARPVWAIGEPTGDGLIDPATQDWIYPVWYGIRETEVLGVREARDNDDERHLCPLQLPVIERAVRLWSAPGETVLSPFAGIGSEGVGALRHSRRFVGVELKPSYFRVAARNLRSAAAQREQDDEPTLFGAGA
ncbi:DNA-methyltransferase [Nonomuraea sp. KM90]|uniref:DNA-methyltransferase n=1 Tax=Nonomuraea sp. KM90 TaxID=3457428 RepID=UPI003FCE547A